MNSSTKRGARGTLLLALGTIIANAAGAAPAQQPAYPPGAVVQPLDTGPGAELRRNLTTLGSNPNSVAALTGAGQAALAMGDSDAALNFFSRADAIAPRDWRVKAGIAAALVRRERAREALPLFAQAVQYGASEADIAGDRGLAYDSIGDPRRAQQDYTLALRRRDDPEVRRRLALSLAISGQREAALRTIDAQLRAHDRAGWRTQAFILALTGDPAGAGRTAQNVMPAGGAQAMAPFFARLASLSPSQKALAVHFGHFPSDGRATAYAQRDISADPGAIALAQGGAPPAPPAARYQPLPPVSSDPRRRPGAAETQPARTRSGRRAGTTSMDLARPALPRGSRSASATSQPATAQRTPVQVALNERRPQPAPPPAPPPAPAPPPVPAPTLPAVPQQAPPTVEPQLEEPILSGSGVDTSASDPAAILPAPGAIAAAPSILTSPAPAPAPAPAETASAGFSLLPQGAQPRSDSPFGPPTPSLSAVAPPTTAPAASAGLEPVQPRADSPFGPPTPAPGTMAPATSAPAASAGIGRTDAVAAEAQPLVSSPFGPPTPSPATTAPAASAGLERADVLADGGLPRASSPFGPPTPPRSPTSPPAPTASPQATATGFDSIAALVASLPAEEAASAPPVRPAPAPARVPVRTAERQPPPIRFDGNPARPADSRTAARGEERTAANSRAGRTRQPANPSRHWVQIAGGADVSALPREFNRLKTMAPALLGSRVAWSTPLNATNRLLVGPFDSSALAQAFVNQLVARRIAAFAWTSPAGQEIERLQTRR